MFFVFFIVHVCLILISYICKWFLIDFLTSIPIEFMFNQNSQNGKTWFKIIVLLKLLRLLRMLRIFNSVIKTFLSKCSNSSTLFRLSRFVCVIIIFVHFCACGWFAIGNYGETSSKYNKTWISTQGIKNNSLWEQYSYSLYWSVVTLCTTGYGDISATNTIEQWFASVCILMGTCFFVYFIGAVVTSMIADGDKTVTEKNTKIEQAQQFCFSKQLPADLSHAIMTHIKYHCQHNYLFDESSVLQCLPSYLRYAVCCNLYIFLSLVSYCV